MKNFSLIRDVDSSGVSGTGHVAEGVQFANGKVVISWLTAVSSVAVYDNIGAVEKIHGHGGNTRIVWVGAELGLSFRQNIQLDQRASTRE
jgi:hypothetical protein